MKPFEIENLKSKVDIDNIDSYRMSILLNYGILFSEQASNELPLMKFSWLNMKRNLFKYDQKDPDSGNSDILRMVYFKDENNKIKYKITLDLIFDKTFLIEVFFEIFNETNKNIYYQNFKNIDNETLFGAVCDFVNLLNTDIELVNIIQDRSKSIIIGAYKVNLSRALTLANSEFIKLYKILQSKKGTYSDDILLNYFDEDDIEEEIDDTLDCEFCDDKNSCEKYLNEKSELKKGIEIIKNLDSENIEQIKNENQKFVKKFIDFLYGQKFKLVEPEFANFYEQFVFVDNPFKPNMIIIKKHMFSFEKISVKFFLFKNYKKNKPIIYCDLSENEMYNKLNQHINEIQEDNKLNNLK